MVFIVSFSIIM